MKNKERLLDLISKKDQMCSEPFNFETVYEWLEELHYLFGLLNFSSSIALATRTIIEQFYFFSEDKKILKEKILLIKAKLTVFEKYEAEKLKNI